MLTWLRTWPGRFELPTLLLLGVVTGGLWGFVEIADQVEEGSTRHFDESLLLMLRTSEDPSDPVGPAWLEEAARDFTSLGGAGVLVFLVAVVVIFLLMQGKRRAALFVLAAVAGGVLVSSLLKLGFERPRPDLVPHATAVFTTSFPSGHSMMSAVVYLTLGALLARVQPKRRLKVFLIGVACVLTLMVGVSRVYLGVHWPTDVLAGWAAGAAWASLCWMIAMGMQRRGAVESDDDSGAPAAVGAAGVGTPEQDR